MKVILLILLCICAAGWFVSDITAKAALSWIKKNGPRPTEDEIRDLVKEVVCRRFRIKEY